MTRPGQVSEIVPPTPGECAAVHERARAMARKDANDEWSFLGARMGHPYASGTTFLLMRRRREDTRREP